MTNTAVTTMAFQANASTSLNVRIADVEGEPWFVAADVANALELFMFKGVSRHLTNLMDDEKRLTPLPNSGVRGGKCWLISESGLYKLIMRSDKPEARKFQDWVTREVLPAIRKTGGYLLNEEARDTARADDRQGMPMPEEFAA